MKSKLIATSFLLTCAGFAQYLPEIELRSHVIRESFKDLSAENARLASEAGVMISINTDAHSPDGFNEIGYGLTVARRAWVGPHQVINCLSWKMLQAFIARKR